MKKLVKDSENNVMELISVNGLIPSGFTLVPEEELEAEELSLARKDRLAAIRAERNQKLRENDTQWLIASKTGQSLTAIETEAQNLRDIPELAEDELALLTDLEAIKAYNPFGA